MQFTITLDEFWMDEDSGSIEDELKKHITLELCSKISKQIDEKIKKTITEEVVRKVNDTLTKRITGEVAKWIEIGKIKPSYHDDEISIEEYVKELFLKHNSWSSPEEKIKDLAKKFGKELKDRYDKLFAIHLINKMKENDLLKEPEIAKLLGD